MSNKRRDGGVIIGCEVDIGLQNQVDEYATSQGMLKKDGSPNRSGVIRLALIEFVQHHALPPPQQVEVTRDEQNGVLKQQTPPSVTAGASEEGSPKQIDLKPQEEKKESEQG